ncbi:MAG TPA: MBL fold metallo-hydrolase [Candidatus Saccharimonadales bacterium]|nr:MBL fold metallo-hydrolase [Candidatus Saccharimonadales bacterium]
MIRPALQNEGFLADVEQARTQPEFLHLWWLGQSGFLVLWQGRHLLLDPYLSDSLTRKYAATDKPHVRMTEHVVEPSRLNFIDVVTSSHSHTDHLDQDTLKPLLKVNPKLELVIPEANRELVVNRLEIMAEVPRGLDAGQSITLAGFKIHAVPAAHNEVEKDPWGRHKFLGYVVEAGPCTLYHSGDTRWYAGMEERLRQWPIDIALLPINGDDPSRRVAGNLNGAEAASLAKAIGAGLVIPCHYQMFEFNTAGTGGFVTRAQELGQPYQILQCGERWSSCGMR